MSLRHRRVISGIIFLCVSTVSLAGVLFIFLHSGHDHTGEVCSVCARMEEACSAARRLLDGLPKTVGLIGQAIMPLFVSMFLLKFFGNIKHPTLITTKVRLND